MNCKNGLTVKSQALTLLVFAHAKSKGSRHFRHDHSQEGEMVFPQNVVLVNHVMELSTTERAY
jgi:hypothetical protein